MRVMYHYDNTDKINSVLLVLKKFKGLKNEIMNLYLDKFNDVMGYATGPRQYPLYFDLELVNENTSSINSGSSGSLEAA